MKHWFLLLALSCGATAQTAGINVSVNRAVTLAPDEAAFTIVLGASLDSSQPQVKQALQEAGLPNPTVVATGLGPDNSVYPGGAARIFYLATVTIAAGSAKEAAKGLDAFRTHLPATLKSLQYSVAFTASQTAIDAAWQTALPQLLADAQKQAQSIAAAAGVKLGAIRSIGDSAGVYGFVTAAFIYDPVAVLSSPRSFSLNVNYAAQ